VGTEKGQGTEFRRIQAAHLEDLPDKVELIPTIFTIDEAVKILRTRPNLHATPFR
jgi:hypothetical protein